MGDLEKTLLDHVLDMKGDLGEVKQAVKEAIPQQFKDVQAGIDFNQRRIMKLDDSIGKHESRIITLETATKGCWMRRAVGFLWGKFTNGKVKT